IERRFTDALQTLEKRTSNNDRLQQLFPRVVLPLLAGQAEAAKSTGEEALPLLEAGLKERPNDTLAMRELSWVYLALGRNADAVFFPFLEIPNWAILLLFIGVPINTWLLLAKLIAQLHRLQRALTSRPIPCLFCDR